MQCIITNYKIVLAILAAILLFLNILLGLKMYLGFETLRNLISANDINKPSYWHTLKILV